MNHAIIYTMLGDCLTSLGDPSLTADPFRVISSTMKLFFQHFHLWYYVEYTLCLFGIASTMLVASSIIYNLRFTNMSRRLILWFSQRLDSYSINSIYKIGCQLSSVIDIVFLGGSVLPRLYRYARVASVPLALGSSFYVTIIKQLQSLVSRSMKSRPDFLNCRKRVSSHPAFHESDCHHCITSANVHASVLLASPPVTVPSSLATINKTHIGSASALSGTHLSRSSNNFFFDFSIFRFFFDQSRTVFL